MKKLFLLIFTFVIGLILVPSAKAIPVLWVDNSHYYDFVMPTSTNDWFSAKTNADSSIYLGLSGHLATITSANENNFLISTFATGSDSFQGAWLGGKAPEGWLDGPENGYVFSYINWGGIEPNNAGYAYMNVGTGGPVSVGQWADDSEIQGFPANPGDPVIGYFIEYEGNNAIPEPATMLLFGTGLAGIFLRKRKDACDTIPDSK
ncbi:MAG TPA: hypothetical protein DD723_02395 [Candidatus Omnitrophica bacterium]|nr:MAG: hypothetical protein A2Z81_01885 [Omnitrophica WOR_2 bacterium GWA2_45_18]OGX21688.1 MAG: hypothetical protein A2Y04_03100 [Omnitrophica WOR_2 bacterium GWC2_45_7]HBR14377.1 hypothetical protein [Candidatus Omnitrophota bacterium]